MKNGMIKEMTTEQKLSAIRLCKAGAYYTKIAVELGLEYKVVNKFMTKWKRREGLLGAKQKVIQKQEPRNPLKEIEFLRSFYLNSIVED